MNRVKYVHDVNKWNGIPLMLLLLLRIHTVKELAIWSRLIPVAAGLFRFYSKQVMLFKLHDALLPDHVTHDHHVAVAAPLHRPA